MHALWHCLKPGRLPCAFFVFFFFPLSSRHRLLPATGGVHLIKIIHGNRAPLTQFGQNSASIRSLSVEIPSEFLGMGYHRGLFGLPGSRDKLLCRNRLGTASAPKCANCHLRAVQWLHTSEGQSSAANATKHHCLLLHLLSKGWWACKPSHRSALAKG